MVDALMQPINITLVLLLALLILLVRRRDRCGRVPLVVCALALAALALSSSRPLSAGLLQLLESGQAHLEAETTSPPDAIVVLGAGIRDRRVAYPTLNESGKERVLEGLRVAQLFPEAAVVFSGGMIEARGIPSARIMADHAERAGLGAGRAVVEGRSQTTRGNAVETAAIARARGWTRLVIVTSAAHMPRSLAAFRKVGLDVVPAPCGFTDAGSSLYDYLRPDARAVVNTHHFLHEVVGRLWYLLRGWA